MLMLKIPLLDIDNVFLSNNSIFYKEKLKMRVKCDKIRLLFGMPFDS